MKNSIKTLFLFLTLSFVFINCNSNDDAASEDDDTSETLFKFEAGDYDISWAGAPFKTTLTKTDENTLTGVFCVNNSIDNCQDIGPITIIRSENTATFHFSDVVCKISEDVPGDFNGTGTITNDNTYRFLVNGEDCKRTYTNNSVIFTKQ